MGRYSRDFVTFVRQYLKYDLRREIVAWWKIAKFYLPIGMVIAALFLATLVYIEPFPRQPTVLAIGQRGTLSNQLGDAFQSYFERQGLPLEIRSRSGLDAVAKDIRDPGSDINASFVVSGAGSPADYPDLVSLGNVAIAPAWLFYRGDTVQVDDPFQYYRDKQIAVGAPGTVSARLFSTLMDLNNPGTGDQPNFLKLPHMEAVEQLLAGKVDAVFIVDGFSSPLIQRLLGDPTVKLMNFALADAYVRRLPFLRKVTVPRGSIDIAEVRPDRDIALLASSANLLVEKDLHPVVQWTFLLAAREISLKSDNFFPVSDTLPQYRDRSFALSPIANRFYTSGVPAIFSYLPLWLAALLENVWVVLLALLLLGLPAFNKIVGFRGFASQKLLWLHFWELRYLEDELVAARTTDDVASVIERLTFLDRKTAETWVQDDQMRHYFNLRRSISSTIQDAQKKNAVLNKP
ncbi:hypothetical protein [Ancylobacter sp. FA202]|uniref:hypothetical protein n=1 Tax=Ancylobacter sp. FA202 TaxID=1111106 RepID=UPI000376FAE2|nr:hypothetical protein [Ancylobacter sp. FA202]